MPSGRRAGRWLRRRTSAAGVDVLVAHTLDLLCFGTTGPKDEQAGLVEPAEQLVGGARRPVRRGAREADEVDGEVAVVGPPLPHPPNRSAQRAGWRSRGLC